MPREIASRVGSPRQESGIAAISLLFPKLLDKDHPAMMSVSRAFACLVLLMLPVACSENTADAPATPSSTPDTNANPAKTVACDFYIFPGGRILMSQYLASGSSLFKDENYTGACADGFANGLGRYSGYAFHWEGSFAGGKPYGYGKATASNSSETYGNYDGDVLQGVGVLIASGDTIYKDFGPDGDSIYARLNSNGAKYYMLRPNVGKLVDASGASSEGLLGYSTLADGERLYTWAEVLAHFPNLTDSVALLKNLMGASFPSSITWIGVNTFTTSVTRAIGLPGGSWIGEIRFSNGTIYQGPMLASGVYSAQTNPIGNLAARLAVSAASRANAGATAAQARKAQEDAKMAALKSAIAGVGNADSGTKEYGSVKIGSYWWMTRNLNIPAAGSVCEYCDVNGRLYDWNTALGICPTGWSLPTDAQWDDLVIALGGQFAAGATGLARAGFNPQFAGSDYKGTPGNVGVWGNWWSSSTSSRGGSVQNPCHRSTEAGTGFLGVGCYDSSVNYKFSVRCIKNP